MNSAETPPVRGSVFTAGNGSATPGARLDLAAVESCLRCFRGLAESGDRALGLALVPVEDGEITNMMLGYALLDDLLAAGIDVFAPGGSAHLLELNARVLCGVDPVERRALAAHLAATEDRFYDQVGGGIGALVEWLKLNRGADAWSRAAGVFAMVIGAPQLFIEGNHRTGMLMMNYVLLRAGKLPFLLCTETAPRFFAIAAAIVRGRGLTLAQRLLAPGRSPQQDLADLLRAEGRETGCFPGPA